MTTSHSQRFVGKRFYVSGDMNTRLHQKAGELGLTQQALITKLIEEGLNGQEGEGNVKWAEEFNQVRLMAVKNTLAKFPADKFKVMFLNWWAESEHAGWDGFAASEILSFYMVIEDFATFVDTLSKEDLQGFFTFGSHTIDASSNGDPQ